MFPVGDIMVRARMQPDAQGVSQNPMQKLITSLLKELGEDPSREGLVKTPSRVEKSLKNLTRGYDMNAGDILEVIGDAANRRSIERFVKMRGHETVSVTEEDDKFNLFLKKSEKEKGDTPLGTCGMK